MSELALFKAYRLFCSALSLVVNVLQGIIVCGQRLPFVCVQHCAFPIVHSAVANRSFEPRLSYHKPVEPLTPENYPLRPPNDLKKSPTFEPGKISPNEIESNLPCCEGFGGYPKTANGSASIIRR